MAVWAFIRLKKRVSFAPAISLPLVGCGCWMLALAMPVKLGGSGAVGPRPALFGILLLVAGAAGAPLSASVKRFAGGAIVAISLVSFLYLSVLTGRAVVSVRPFLDAAPASPGLTAAWVAGPHTSPTALNWEPELWAAGHYARRSKAVLINFPWLNLAFMPLTARNPGACAYDDPAPMAECLAAASSSASSRPDFDLLIAQDIEASALTARYGLLPISFNAGDLVVYAKPRTNAPK
jgi:hypothetical protein